MNESPIVKVYVNGIIGSLEDLDDLFEIMEKRNVEILELGDVKIHMQHPYITKAKKETEERLSEASDEEPKAAVKIEEPKHYSNDEILLDPYVGLDNG